MYHVHLKMVKMKSVMQFNWLLKSEVHDVLPLNSKDSSPNNFVKLCIYSGIELLLMKQTPLKCPAFFNSLIYQVCIEQALL